MRRAGVKVLALLAVTAALALLVAVLSRQAWPPVLVAILGTLPALYVAWLAVPGVVRSPTGDTAGGSASRRQAGRWDAMELGVHQVIGGGALPTYIRRPHDELLRALLDPAVAASRLVVLRGGSSTGKTRAAYEAVVDRLADWHLDYPLDTNALAARLAAGIPARTVLWLGELRQYADADGGPAVLGRLADLLEGEGPLVITTLWPEHWVAYTSAARAGPGPADPAGTAGRLLARLPELSGTDPVEIDPRRGGIIDIPDRFTTAEIDAAADTGDKILAGAAEAAARAGQDGQIAQYLAGVPDLLRRYNGLGADPYGHAVITAAVDAVRLGYASPLPAAMLVEAAVGYLTSSQRTTIVDRWREAALAWATEQLNGAVRALNPVPPPAAIGVTGYQLADYLEQHGRETRQDQLGPVSLWNAVVKHATSIYDLTRLGQEARDRGLYRHAAALWTAAAPRSTDAARRLITLLCQVRPDDTTSASEWVASRASLDDLTAAALLLRELRQTDAHDAVTTLAIRAADQASLNDAADVASLLGGLCEVGSDEAVRALLARDPVSQVRLDDPAGAALLLWELREARADKAVHALLARDPADKARLDDPVAVAVLLEELREADADEAVRTLLARNPVSQVRLDDPTSVAFLVEALMEADADEAVTALAIRAADHAGLNDPRAVTSFLTKLREAGAYEAVRVLLAADPASHIRSDNPQTATSLLAELGDAKDDGAVHTVAARAAHAIPDNSQAVSDLLRMLHQAGAGEAANTLAARAANAGMFDLYLHVHRDEALSYQFGREPDGAPSQPWNWRDDLASA